MVEPQKLFTIERGVRRKILELFGKNKSQNGQVLQLPSEDPEYMQKLTVYQNRMARMRKVLEEVCLVHLEQRFIQHDVSVENVPDLSDEDFRKLGVEKIGDKDRLRRKCRDLQNGTDDGNDFYKEDQIMEVNMAERSSFQMGDRDNNITSESIINAKRIDTVGQGGVQSRIASSTSTKVSMGAHSKFEAVNKNNKLQSSTTVDATHLQSVGGMGGLSGLQGMGGPAGNININMGDGASLQGLGMNGYDSRHTDHRNGTDGRRFSGKGGIYESKKFPGYMIYKGDID